MAKEIDSCFGAKIDPPMPMHSTTSALLRILRLFVNARICVVSIVLGRLNHPRKIVARPVPLPQQVLWFFAESTYPSNSALFIQLEKWWIVVAYFECHKWPFLYLKILFEPCFFLIYRFWYCHDNCTIFKQCYHAGWFGNSNGQCFCAGSYCLPRQRAVNPSRWEGCRIKLRTQIAAADKMIPSPVMINAPSMLANSLMVSASAGSECYAQPRYILWTGNNKLGDIFIDRVRIANNKNCSYRFPLGPSTAISPASPRMRSSTSGLISAGKWREHWQKRNHIQQLRWAQQCVKNTGFGIAWNTDYLSSRAIDYVRDSRMPILIAGTWCGKWRCLECCGHAFIVWSNRVCCWVTTITSPLFLRMSRKVIFTYRIGKYNECTGLTSFSKVDSGINYALMRASILLPLYHPLSSG